MTKIKYGEYSRLDDEYCSLSSYYYEIIKKETYIYQKIEDIRYVLLENFNYEDNITIYYENKPIKFKIINYEDSQLKLDLNFKYQSETLLFSINGDENYKIGLYSENDFKKEIISKEINGEKIIVPDKNWITSKTTFLTTYAETKLKESALTKKTSIRRDCKYREKYVYKYEISKEYYDDEYHLNVEGYIKDSSDYKIFYKGEPITNTVEIINEKIVKEPQIEYIYIENEKKINKNDSSNEKKETATLNEITCTQTATSEVIEKEIKKIPKTIYIIIILFLLIIVLLTIKLYKKYVA